MEWILYPSLQFKNLFWYFKILKYVSTVTSAISVAAKIILFLELEISAYTEVTTETHINFEKWS